VLTAYGRLSAPHGDGTLYAVKDRHETAPIKSGENQDADLARKLLQGALDSMPEKAAKLRPGRKKKRK
jgi:hypothetical protein